MSARVMRAFADEFGEPHVETPDEAPSPAERARPSVAAASSDASNAAEPEPTPARESDDSTSDDTLTFHAARDEARLLVQSPEKLFFYWSFARDPHPTLRPTWRSCRVSKTGAKRLST